MTNAAELEGRARDEIAELLPNTSFVVETGLFSEAWSQICPGPSDDVLDDIARDDPTYQTISDTLIPHSCIPGLYLLRYQTMHGALAYQPCSKDIDIMGFFDPVAPLENRDPLFKYAREWSCVIQSMEWLPRDVRWVLAVIYNFANEMLRAENSEACLWYGRGWLLYWYEIADGLFEKYRIIASTPDEDWFLRPLHIQENPFDAAPATVGIISQLQHAPCSLKVSRTKPETPRVNSSDGDLDMDVDPRIEAWVESQAHIIPAREPTPPAPQRRRLEGPRDGDRSRLNPAAAVFTPASFRFQTNPTSPEAQIS